MGTWGPKCLSKKIRGWAQDTWGTPSPNVHFPQGPICSSAHFQTFRGNGLEHLGYSFPPNVHLPQVSIYPSAHLLTFVKMGIGHVLGVPF